VLRLVRVREHAEGHPRLPSTARADAADPGRAL
jgi:hypothetical protein